MVINVFFTQVLNFLKGVVAEANIAEDAVQIGIVTFSYVFYLLVPSLSPLYQSVLL